MTTRKHRWNPFSISFDRLDFGLTIEEILADLDHGRSASDETSRLWVEASAA
jgi:hypothetical protein